jgi:hypothetical protein
MATRPLDGATPRYPNFATADSTDPVSGEANVQAPSSEVQVSGWRRLERPPRYWLNWLHRLYNQWVQWFDQEIEAFRIAIVTTIPGAISGLDGRLDTIENTVNVTVDGRLDTVENTVNVTIDGRLDTIETAVNTTIDGRLDNLESFQSNVGAQYSLPYQIGVANMEFAGIGSANVTANGYYILHYAYSTSGAPQKVTLRIQGINGVASGTFAKFETATNALPAAIRPQSGTARAFSIMVQNNSNYVPGMLYINDNGKVMVQCLVSGAMSGDFSLTGNKGFVEDIVVEYIID